MKSKEKTQTKENEFGREQEKLMSEIATRAIKNYEQAVRTGLKLQEEAAQWFTGLAGQSTSTQGYPHCFAKLTSVVSEALPVAQKRMDEVIELAEKNSRKSIELMKKVADAAQTPVIAESQAKWVDVGSESLAVARNNVEVLTQLGNKAFDSWIDYVRKNTDVTEVRMPKAA